MDNSELITRLQHYIEKDLGHISIKDLYTILRMETVKKSGNTQILNNPLGLRLMHLNTDNRLDAILYTNVEVQDLDRGVTLGDILKYSERELLNFKGLGPISLGVIKKVASGYNLKLKENE